MAKEGEVDNSVISLEKSLENEPSNPYAKDQICYQLYKKGITFYNDRKYKEAISYFNRSMKYDTKAMVHALNHLGNISYFRQDISKAEEYWNKALSHPLADEMTKAAIKIKLEKKKVESETEGELQSYESENFIISYDKVSDASGYQLRSVLRDAYRKVGRDFGYYPEEKVNVIVFDSDRFVKSTQGGHGGIRAVYDGKIRLPVIKDKRRMKEFKSLLWHEYTHALVFDLSGSSCPTWFNEGLAQYEEDKIDEVDMGYLKAAIRKDKYIVFSKFFSSTNALSAGVDVTLFYQQSFSMMQYLLKRYRLFKVKKVLVALKKGNTFDEAFEKVFYMNSERFEEKWLAYAKKHN